ncbi:MAG: ferrous iron transport protein B, partial [Candidatus Omnitrophota bacterium]
MKKKWKIAIAGNPNSGKTTLFNALTGAKQTVGNWPGVTVERKVGSLDYKGKKIDVIDLPGIYSLSTSSRDEKIARDYILRKKPDVVVNIVDASNLERTLYLTIQLIEMKVPLVIVLNMIDMVKRKNLKIKIEQLTHLLDCPVVCTVAHKEEGIQAFKETIYRVLDRKHISSTRVHFPEEIEEAIAKIIAHLKLHHSEDLAERYDARWMAIKLLETDSDMEKIEQCPEVKELVAREQKKIEDIRGEETDIIIAEGRYGFINAMCKNVLDKTNIVRKDISDSIDKIALNRIFGIPLFLCAMYFVFWITINLGNCFIDFFDLLFGTLCVDGFGMFLMRIGVPSFMQTILADGIGGGIQTVSTFIPPIFFMFVCLAILEDSGYMARAAFIMDRSMKTIGLPGKAFVPLLVGFGCTVPAIMATRTLDNEKDRILTIMINPLMSCGARMPVYAVFAAVFFPESGDTIVFALYLVGIVLAVMTAFLLKGTILGGEPSSFIMELPPYHIPTIRGILIHTWERLKTFIIRAGKAIVFVVVL